MIDVKRFNELKTRVDKLQRDKDRAEGALAQLMERLKSEHGCGTIEEAEAKLSDLRKKTAAKERVYNQALGEFEQDWSASLGKGE